MKSQSQVSVLIQILLTNLKMYFRTYFQFSAAYCIKIRGVVREILSKIYDSLVTPLLDDNAETLRIL